MKKIWVVLGVILLTGLAGVVSYLIFNSSEKPTSVENSQPSAPKAVYVAMGDSVASGLGPGADSDARGCGRTDAAYPQELARQGGYELTQLACSGATLAAGMNGPQTTDAGVQVPQKERLFTAKPNLITLTIGANDVGWLNLLLKCYQASCGSSSDEAQFQGSLNTLKTQLAATLRSIDEHYETNPKLLVVGYYQVFPEPGATCSDVAGLDAADLAFGRSLRTRLNQALSDTVDTTGVGEFVEIDFTGHELCSAEPWIQGLRDKAAYHANKAGQTEIARQLSAKLEAKEGVR